jgi:hypothetical protein
MAGITGQGTTFNLPNFVGELFAVSREDTPFLSSIGGLTGGRAADSTLFQWTTYDLRAAADDRQRLEGANAPTAEERVRGNVFNVVEIHQETIEVSYTKLAATGQFNSTGSTHPGSVGISGSNAVGDEMAWQITQALKQIARDVNKGFLTGTFANPATNATARKTRGLLAAITTNALDGAGTADLASTSGDLLGDLMQDVWDNGGIRESETRTLLCNSTQKRKLTERYITGANYRETSRNVGGVNVTVLETDFGSLNVMLEPAMPQDQIAVVSLGECAPRFLPVPGKGYMFVEPLSKTGAAEKSQIYGEVGLEYGVESHHGKYIGLAV